MQPILHPLNIWIEAVFVLLHILTLYFLVAQFRSTLAWLGCAPLKSLVGYVWHRFSPRQTAIRENARPHIAEASECLASSPLRGEVCWVVFPVWQSGQNGSMLQPLPPCLSLSPLSSLLSPLSPQARSFKLRRSGLLPLPFRLKMVPQE